LFLVEKTLENLCASKERGAESMHWTLRGILTSLLIGVTALSIPYSALAQNTGKISGIVIGDDGTLLAAVVTAHRQGMPAATGRADSATDGSFAITGLPSGAYGLCAVVRNGGYLDPCAWSAVIPSVQLDAGKAVTAYRLTLTKGDLLQVRVNDQSQARAKCECQRGHSGEHQRWWNTDGFAGDGNYDFDTS
jgi:hypothetical protein